MPGEPLPNGGSALAIVLTIGGERFEFDEMGERVVPRVATHLGAGREGLARPRAFRASEQPAAKGRVQMWTWDPSRFLNRRRLPRLVPARVWNLADRWR